MAGRPKKEDSRDNQYRVRLNDDENEMLTYVSQMTEKAKSEVFRQALTELYHKTKLAEAMQDFADESEEYDEYEPTWEDEHVSLRRTIDCPYCGHTHMMDFTDDSVDTSYERSMGAEILHEFDLDECVCDQCGKFFSVKGYISEYPMGCYNHEEINVEPIGDVEEGE